MELTKGLIKLLRDHWSKNMDLEIENKGIPKGKLLTLKGEPKKFLTLPEFMSLMDSEVEGEVDERWTKHWEVNLPKLLEEGMKIGHAGDCTKIACTCPLCFIETMLKDYYKYRFPERSKNEK